MMNENESKEFFIIGEDILRYVMGADLAVKAKTVEPEEVDVNMLLDQYNDYMVLYKMFGDEGYRNKADQIMSNLKGIN